MYHHGGINSYWTRKPNYVYARERVSMRQAFAREEERSRAPRASERESRCESERELEVVVGAGGWVRSNTV
jgi:hypothetical protein